MFTKNLTLTAILAFIFANAVPAFCQENHEENDAPPPPNSQKSPKNPQKQTPKKPSKEELEMMKSLFSMSNEQLTRVRETIERLERTPLQKRKEMAEDLEKANSDDPAVRQKFMEEMRERFERDINNLLSRYYASLPEDQAKTEAEAFLKMSKNEKREYVMKVREKLGMKNPQREMRGRNENSRERNSSETARERQFRGNERNENPQKRGENRERNTPENFEKHDENDDFPFPPPPMDDENPERENPPETPPEDVPEAAPEK